MLSHKGVIECRPGGSRDRVLQGLEGLEAQASYLRKGCLGRLAEVEGFAGVFDR